MSWWWEPDGAAMPSPFLVDVEQCPSCNWMLDPEGRCLDCGGGYMRVSVDRSELPVPGVCFVCETAPQGRAVDTLQTFSPGFLHPLSGAKLVCEGCGAAVAEAFGFVPADVRDEAVRRAALAEAKFVAAVDDVREFARQVAEGRLEEVAARVEPEVAAVEVAEERPDLVAAQAEVAQREAVEPNAVEPVARVVPEKAPRGRKADASS